MKKISFLLAVLLFLHSISSTFVYAVATEVNTDTNVQNDIGELIEKEASESVEETNGNLEEQQQVEEGSQEEQSEKEQPTDEGLDQSQEIVEDQKKPTEEIEIESPQEEVHSGMTESEEDNEKEIKGEKQKDNISTDSDQNDEEIGAETLIQKSSIQLFSTTQKTISRLGHIKNGSVRIYPDVSQQSKYFEAGSTYTNQVYYIKLQMEYKNNIYYLISKNSSSTVGVVGWIKSTDMQTYEHKKIDDTPKTFYIQGTGSAYSKAWGGRKNFVYENLKPYTNQTFAVNLTESVGDDIWYRGKLNGKTTWIQETNVSLTQESTISRLGHINNGKVRIYQDVTQPTKFKEAGSAYTNEVYYIKKQIKYENQTYYLISKNSSSTVGVVGWIKSTDMQTYEHKKVDDTPKTFYIKGTGSSYSKAWGGRKNFVYESLKSYEGQSFIVNLTESVGNNIWYRGTLNGKSTWIQETNITSGQESTISRLGHINNGKVRIYEDVTQLTKYKEAGSTYTNEVYYIKKQIKTGNQIYYLISKNSSSTVGVVGWVKSTDMQTHEHKKVDDKPKTFYIKGTGSAYSKAWGGRKNYSVENLTAYKNQVFHVNLTESVGSDIWYRGKINGKTSWLKETQVSNYSSVESKVSLLGHIKNGNVSIFKDYTNSKNSFKASSQYTNQVYFIKRKATMNNQTYYLLSLNSSDTVGVVGWVNAKDLNVKNHSSVDKNKKVFYLNGTGSAYLKAWGGKKNINQQNLDLLIGQKIEVDLTEKVGNDTWYRGRLNGNFAWVKSSQVSTTPVKLVNTKYTNYNLTINQMIDIQFKATPQTDKRYPLWVREDAFESISNNSGVIAKGSNWNLRRGPGTNEAIHSQVKGGTKVTIYGKAKATDNTNYTWYHVDNTLGWVIPETNDLKYYLNPGNFVSFKDSLQFLKLSQSTNIDVNEVNNKILKDKGILVGTAQAFKEAGSKYRINEIYLISHALLETGNGKSVLAKGVKYKDKIVYNMFGIGAFDQCPIDCGAKHAYDNNWITPEIAIIEGSKFIAEGYVNQGLDTLYKMRWNPEYASNKGVFGKQYATDIGWAHKQTTRINTLYQLLDSYSITLDIPKYK